MSMNILEDLIKKCEKASLSNRGGAGGYITTSSVIQENGKSLADNPRLNYESLRLYKGMGTVKLKVLNVPEGTVVNFVSSNTTIATIGATSGSISFKKAGECVLTASFTDEDGVEYRFDCPTVCSGAVAMVADTEYTDINDAVEMAMKRYMPLIPLQPSVIYYFNDTTEVVQVRTVYSNAKFYGRPPAFTEEHAYEVREKRVDSETKEYYLVDVGTPEVEFTNAKTGAVSYLNLSDAFSTAGTYRILKDIPEMSHTLYCDLGLTGGDMVIDLDGHHLVATKNTKKKHGSFSIACLDVSRANVVVNGNGGSLTATEDSDLYGIHKKYSYTVTLNDVSVIGATHAVYAEDGFYIINGGRFEVYPWPSEKDPAGYGYTLNCLDAKYQAGTANIAVNAGSFFRFNPGDCIAEGDHTSFVAEGKTVTYDEATETYTVA